MISYKFNTLDPIYCADRYIAAGSDFVLGLRSDGRVMIAGDRSEGKDQVEQWKNIVMIAAGSYHCVGLDDSGNVRAAGSSGSFLRDPYRITKPTEVYHWSDIVSIAANDYCTIGLKRDGTLVVAGGRGISYDSYEDYDRDIEEVDSIKEKITAWKDVVAFDVSQAMSTESEVVAVLSDGTLKSTRYRWQRRLVDGNFEEVSKRLYYEGKPLWVRGIWKGQKKGDFAFVDSNQKKYICEGFDKIKRIDSKDSQNDFIYIYPTKEVVSYEYNKIITGFTGGPAKGVSIISDSYIREQDLDVALYQLIHLEKNVVAIQPAKYGIKYGGSNIYTLHSDGTVHVCGKKGEVEELQRQVSNWKLFDSYKTADQEYQMACQMAREKKKERADRMSRKVCTYCGGPFKGLIAKKCVICGREKDY